MTREDIIELATKVYGECDWHESALHHLEAFAKLVADKKVEGMVMMTPDEFKSIWDKAQAEEREACALIGDGYHDEEANCGDLIRLRGGA
jgi:hypothetical protein